MQVFILSHATQYLLELIIVILVSIHFELHGFENETPAVIQVC